MTVTLALDSDTKQAALGDVMKESAQIVLSDVRSHAAELCASVRADMAFHLARWGRRCSPQHLSNLRRPARQVRARAALRGR